MARRGGLCLAEWPIDCLLFCVGDQAAPKGQTALTARSCKQSNQREMKQVAKPHVSNCQPDMCMCRIHTDG